MTCIDEPVNQWSSSYKELFESLGWYNTWVFTLTLIYGKLVLYLIGVVKHRLASMLSVRTTEFKVRTLNTVVRIHYTPLHGRLPKSGYKGTVLKTVRSVKRHVGSNPTFSFVLSTTQNYWERNPLSRTNTDKSEVDCFILPPPHKGFIL